MALGERIVQARISSAFLVFIGGNPAVTTSIVVRRPLLWTPLFCHTPLRDEPMDK